MVSYSSFFGGALMGPFFEFADYRRFIEEKGEYKNAPSPILASLYYLALGIFCLVLFMVGSSYYWIEFCWDPKFAELSLI